MKRILIAIAIVGLCSSSALAEEASVVPDLTDPNLQDEVAVMANVRHIFDDLKAASDRVTALKVENQSLRDELKKARAELAKKQPAPPAPPASMAPPPSP